MKKIYNNGFENLSDFPRNEIMNFDGVYRPGYISYNASSVYTFLLKKAAMCEHYASDILYNIKEVEAAIEGRCMMPIVNDNGEIENISPVTVYFGFRDMGVDGYCFINSRLDSPECYGKLKDAYINGLYCVELTASEKYANEFTATLYEIQL